MPVRNLQTITPTVWTPPWTTATYAITITRSDGSIDDVTDLCLDWMFQDAITESIGNFDLTLPNPNEAYSGVYTGMEVVRFYTDYNTTASTVVFKGYVEKPSANKNNLRLTGRTSALFAFVKDVTKTYANTDAAQVIVDLFNTYGDGHYTHGNVPASIGVDVNTSFSETPFWDCIKRICHATGYDCYVDNSDDVHFFEHGSITNGYDALVHENNIIETGDFSPDITQVKNKIVVYGATNSNGLQPIATSQDTVSQARYGIRPLLLQDDSAQTDQQTQDLSDAELTYYTNPPIVGDVKGLLLATIQPGEALPMSDPPNNLLPATYVVTKYKHEYSNESGGPYTTVTIERETHRLSNIFALQVQATTAAQNTSINPEGMDFTYGLGFFVDTGSHTSTQITNGILRLQVGQSSGTWVSQAKELTNTLSQVYVVANGQTLTGIIISVSGDGGNNYETVSTNTLHTVSNVGTSLRLKVDFTDSTTQVNSINVLYKTT